MMRTLPETGCGLVAGRPELPFKRLLVPLDGSELAEQALPFARRLARLGGGDLLLVRTALSQPGRGEPTAAQAEVAADAERYLRRLMSGFNADFSVEVATPCGDPVTEIAGIAGQRNVDLVVMTTHGRSGLSRLVLGSVADGLVRRTRLPLLLIKAGLTTHRWERGIRRILVPLDGSKMAESVLPAVAALAEAARAKLTLLQVVGPQMPELTAYEIAYLPEDDRVLAEQARASLARVADRLRRRGLEVEVQVAFGKPADEIARAAGQEGCDLVAMATHARGGLDRMMVGSVADGVLHEANAPLLLFRGIQAGQAR